MTSPVGPSICFQASLRSAHGCFLLSHMQVNSRRDRARLRLLKKWRTGHVEGVRQKQEGGAERTTPRHHLTVILRYSFIYTQTDAKIGTITNSHVSSLFVYRDVSACFYRGCLFGIWMRRSLCFTRSSPALMHRNTPR